MLLTRSQFLGAKKRRFKNVPIPDGIELGDGTVTKDAAVRIQSLTARELDVYESSTYKVSKAGDKLLLDRAGLQDHRRRLVRLVAVEDNDSSMFGPEHDEALFDTDGIIASIVYREACKHCGIKELDESAEKN